MSGSIGGDGRGYSFRLSAEGLTEFAAGMNKLAESSELAKQTLDKLTQASPQLANAMTTAEEAMKRASARTAELGKDTQGLQTAFGDLKNTLQQAGIIGTGGPLGEVGGAIGKVAESFKGVGDASRAGAAGVALLNPLLAATTTLVTAAVVAWANWDNIVGLVRGNVLGLDDGLARLNRRLEEASAFFDTTAERAERLERATRAIGAVNFSTEALELGRRRAEAVADLAEVERTVALAQSGGAGAIPLDARSREQFSRRGAELRDEIAAYDAAIARAEAGRQRFLAGPSGAQREQPRTIFEWRGDDPRATVFPVDAFPPPHRGAGAGARPRTIYEDLGLGAGQTVFPTEATSGPLAEMAEARARAWQRSNEAIAREEERAQDRRERDHKQSTDDIVRYAGDRFADLARTTDGNWRQAFDSIRSAGISTFARLGAEAVIRPIVAPIVAGANGMGFGYGATAGPGAAGGLGGFSSLLGFGNLFPGGGGEFLNSIGLGGLGTGITGFLGSPILGGSALSSATNSALGAMGALYGPAAPSSLGLGGVTFGQALGGIGGGFTIGSLLGSLVAGDSAARQTNAQLGAGGGAVAGAIIGSLIPGVGTVLGGLLGGGAGGGLGGLLGPGRAFSGGDALIGRTNDGFLTVTGFAGKGYDGSALTAEAQRQVEAINATLRAANIRVTSGMRANMGGGESPNPTTALGAIQQFGFGFGSDDPSIARAIAPFGNNLEGALGAAAWQTELNTLTASLNAGANAIRQVTRQFEAGFEKARQYGFGLEEVTRAQNAALGNLIAPTIGSLADTLAAARLGAESPLSPRARAAAAQAEVSQLAARARGGDLTAYGRLQSATQTAIAVNREVFGGGAAGVAGFNTILERMEELVGGGAEMLTAALYTAETRSQTDVLSAEIQRLRAEVAGLRADMGQVSRMPDRLR